MSLPSISTTPLSDRRIVLVWRKTRLQELVERFNTWPQAKFYLEHNNTDAQDYLAEHDHYQAQLGRAEALINPLGKLQKLERSLLPAYQFRPDDLVVVVGQDGLVANTLKYLDGQPVIAANPDPERWDGVLLPFEVAALPGVLKRTINDQAPSKTITLAQATTNDGQRLLAVNDLFIGPQSHTSARYVLHWQGQSEVQSSSGIIVSTGFVSTGWLQSVVAGALGVASEVAGGLAGNARSTAQSNEQKVSSATASSAAFAWDAQHLQFSVREPFPSRTSSTNLVYGAITETANLRIESQMPERGVIFSDGIEQDFLAFNSGCLATIGLAKQQGQLMVEG